MAPRGKRGARKGRKEAKIIADAATLESASEPEPERHRPTDAVAFISIAPWVDKDVSPANERAKQHAEIADSLNKRIAADTLHAVRAKESTHDVQKSLEAAEANRARKRAVRSAEHRAIAEQEAAELALSMLASTAAAQAQAARMTAVWAMNNAALQANPAAREAMGKVAADWAVESVRLEAAKHATTARVTAEWAMKSQIGAWTMDARNGSTMDAGKRWTEDASKGWKKDVSDAQNANTWQKGLSDFEAEQKVRAAMERVTAMERDLVCCMENANSLERRRAIAEMKIEANELSTTAIPEAQRKADLEESLALLREQSRQTSMCQYYTEEMRMSLNESRTYVRTKCRKTVMCRYFQGGACTRVHCNFAHSNDEIRDKPKLKQVCRGWLQGCCTLIDCKYSHGHTEEVIEDSETASKRVLLSLMSTIEDGETTSKPIEGLEIIHGDGGTTEHGEEVASTSAVPYQ